MIGAIIGDIVGSRFEFNNHRSKSFELFADDCQVTDDSIMTLAVAKAIMEAAKIKETFISEIEDDRDYYALVERLTVKYMQEIGRKYPNCGYGGMVSRWVFDKDPQPYHSFGNGAAMRISPAGFVARTEREAKQFSKAVTGVTHNHDEGLKGAEAIALAIFMARQGYLKNEIRQKITSDYYPIDFTIDNSRSSYRFNATCQKTVPQAIACFLESTSFEDAIRTAISLGGDSDTIGAITGAIAEAYYGFPQKIKEKALTYLDEELRAIYDDWVAFIPPCDEKFRVMTKYIGRLSDRTMIDGYTIKYMDNFPFNEFMSEWLCSEFQHYHYVDVLTAMGIALSFDEITQKSVDDLDTEQVRALITAAFRHDYNNNGILIDYIRSGTMQKWLKRLKDIDWLMHLRQISELELELGGWSGYNTHRVIFTDEKAIFSMGIFNDSEPLDVTEEKENIAVLRQAIDKIHFEYWLPGYPQEGEMLICDGEQWKLTVKYDDGTLLDISGDNTYPENWNALLDFFGIDYDTNEDERQPSEIIYCSILFDGGKTYYYTTEDESIEIGDQVIVSVGADNKELTGIVENIEYFLPENVPFPLNKTKAITSKVDELKDDEGDGVKKLR